MINFFRQRRQKAKGFTIIELMVSLTVLTLLALFAGRIYLNYTAASRDLKGANLVYEEARFLMERMVREVRQNAIDYEEYFNQNSLVSVFGGGYGDHYCWYDAAHYDPGPDADYFTPEDNESIGMIDEDVATILGIGSPEPKVIEDELYLINISGTRRTFIKRIERDVDGVLIGKLSQLEMVGKDFGTDGIDRDDSYNGLLPTNISCADTTADVRENDGLIDTWHCDPDYPCDREVLLDDDIFTTGCEGYGHEATDDAGFIDISPSAVNIVDLKFIITPVQDPWKAYNVDEVQIQPYVTIQMTAEANPNIVAVTDPDRIPQITLTSTVSTRIYDEVKSRCQ